MNSRKERHRLRRRAEKLMQEAWEAAHAGKLVLAQKLSCRAREIGEVNPRILNDHGQILALCQQPRAAEEAFRRALTLSPEYEEARTNLKQLRQSQGKPFRRRQVKEEEAVPQESLQVCAFTPRTERLAWPTIESELLRQGCAVLPDLVSEKECLGLRSLFDRDEIFEHTLIEDRPDAGRLTARFFQVPLPELVGALRQEIHGRAAQIANGWNELLGRKERLPLLHRDFLDQCHAAGQTRTAPALVRYPPGGFAALHQDVSGELVFPLQLAVTLGPGSSKEGGGGEFVQVDLRPGKRQRRRQLESSSGDGLLFCSRERLARVGGIHGLQQVVHGTSEVESSEQYVVSIPFHDYG